MNINITTIFSCFLLCSALNQSVFAQCLQDNHSTNVVDHWESCQTATSPNPIRGSVYWVMYDLGYLYSLQTTHFWNYNVTGETGKGFKDLFIDYSTDGANWTEVADFQLDEATGTPTYLGVDGPDLGGIRARYVLISAVNTWGNEPCAGFGELKIEVDMGVQINATIYLEGNYDGTGNSMTDDLRSLDLIPSFEPYSNLNYEHINGGGFEFVSNSVLNSSGNDAIVDWVVVELRDQTDPTLIVATKAVLLQKDGDIVATDGNSPVIFENIISDNYYIVIKHRNHLGIITDNTHSLSSNATVLDFTTDLSLTKGALNGIAALPNNKYGLYSGDFDNNNQVQNADQTGTILKIGTAGYLQADIDLNGQVQNADLQLKLTPNIGKGSQY